MKVTLSLALLTALVGNAQISQARVASLTSQVSADEATIQQDADHAAAMTANIATLQAEVNAHAADPDSEPLPDNLAAAFAALGVTVPGDATTSGQGVDGTATATAVPVSTASPTPLVTQDASPVSDPGQPVPVQDGGTVNS